MTRPYSMIIRWSDEDQVYVVRLPEFGKYCMTHGATYEEAVKNGQEVMDMLIESLEAEGRPLPKPDVFSGETGEVSAAEERISAKQ